MFKKVVLVIVSLFSLTCIVYSATIEQFNADRNRCYKIGTSSCMANLLKKYDSISSANKHILMYDYAQMLNKEKKYSRALQVYNYIIENEYKNKTLVTNAKIEREKIKYVQSRIKSSAHHDHGNYYNPTSVYRWADPKNIKVYFASKTGKESIAKKAFETWSQRTGGVVNFYFVTDPRKADIICRYVKIVDENSAGKTFYRAIKRVKGNVIMVKVEVALSLLVPNQPTMKYSNQELLGIALHEVEHALGVPYHSQSRYDILYPDTSTYRNGKLSQRDINTIKAIYSK